MLVRELRSISSLVTVQIFELWEKPSAKDGTPCHYVKCIYNHEELPLAHHSNGRVSTEFRGLNPLLMVPVGHFSKERHHCM